MEAAVVNCADALRTLHPDGCFEIRVKIGENRWTTYHFDDPDEAGNFAETLNAQGVYVTLNPVRPGLGKQAAKDDDIEQRRWILLDFDPDRPKDVCATEEERERAHAAAQKAARLLSERGFPSPLFQDSGNGAHLFYRVDLPNDEESRELVRNFIRGVAALVPTPGVKIDPAVSNAARIVRLSGTWNRKGENTPERPHRMCVMQESTTEVVTRQLLERVAEERVIAPVRAKTNLLELVTRVRALESIPQGKRSEAEEALLVWAVNRSCWSCRRNWRPRPTPCSRPRT